MDPLKSSNQPLTPNGTQPPVPANDASSQPPVSQEVEVSLNNDVKPEQASEQYSAAEPALQTVSDASAQPAPGELANPAESTAPNEAAGVAPTEAGAPDAPTQAGGDGSQDGSQGIALQPVIQDGQATPAPATDADPADPNQPTPASADPLNVAPAVVPSKKPMMILLIVLVAVLIAGAAAYILSSKL